MLDAIIWGLVQGLTEFLPISSSGHLILVPSLLEAAGFDIGEPSLAVSAVLHLGTLAAVLIYYREDLLRLTRFRTDATARHTLTLLAIGTVPAVVGLPLRDTIDRFGDDPRQVGIALVGTAVILFVGSRFPTGTKRIGDGSRLDALVIGISQAFALVPGISRSGATIATGLGRGLGRVEAARFSFLLAIPAITGAGLLSVGEVAGDGGDVSAILVGFVVATVSGYAAIALLVRLLVTRGFGPFIGYCLAVGALAIAVL